MTPDSSAHGLLSWPFSGGEMASAIRSRDWDSTPLGPIEGWPAGLRQSIDLMLGCAFPATLQWGGDLLLFYNDAYTPLIGSRHRAALGKPILETFPEIAGSYRPFSDRVLAGERMVLHDQLFRYVLHEKPEDRWFDLSYSPIFGDDGSVSGILAIGLETTARVVAERAKEDTERRLRRVLETDAVGVIFFDYNGTVVGANDVFLRLTGYTKHDAESGELTWRKMTPPEWVPASEEQMRNLASTGKLGPYQKEYFLKDGSRRYMLSAGRDLGDGTIAEYCIDVSDRRKAELALQASEQRFRALAEATSDVLYRMNPDWTEMRELRGRDLRANTESSQQTWMDKYAHPDDQSAAGVKIQEAIRTRSVFQMEHRVLRADGSTGWIFSRAIPILDERGQIIEWFGAATDITVRKSAEASLMRSEKLATLGRLAASIAHEINNPLEAITNLLFLIKISDQLPEQARHNVDVAEAELKRIAHITRQSLGFYREISAPSRTSVAELLDASIDLLKGKIRAKNARVERDWNGELALTAVPGELRQIFSNLLANSLDAVRTGGRICIRARVVALADHSGARGVRVTFADNGKGIKREIRASIFDPFYTTKEGTGTGLGLWVTKQIIEKHGGRIWMRTRSEGEPTGTAFVVFLPERETSSE